MEEKSESSCNERNLSTRCLSTQQTESTIKSRTSRQTGESRESSYVTGECINNARVRTLSELYRPTFHKYPTFPSIYESKYQRDFRYAPFPVPHSCKDAPERTKYLGCGFGQTTYKNEFQHANTQLRRKPLPFSPHRKNNPQPRMTFTHYPNQTRWVWSQLEGKQINNTGILKNFPKIHRWNSR